ncbi:MAG: electron transfer flavoprotein subunit beta [Clostridia bacterium]|nr:MAG: electron transfer flavoprotein subunit beta [Clostridia bacterium]
MVSAMPRGTISRMRRRNSSPLSRQRWIPRGSSTPERWFEQMLKILVCVKQVPDVDQMRMDPETGNLVRAGVPAILNPQDANAVAAAVRVKETFGGEITLITMGPPAAEAVLRECLAVGADQAVLVTDPAFGNADTLATSYSIFSAAQTQGSYDMIFCGKESLDGATGQMGAQLAQRFGAAQVTSTLLIREVDEAASAAVVDRALDNGVETLKVKLPALFTIEKGNYPARIPSLKGKMAAKKAAVTVISANDIPDLDRNRIGNPGSPTKVPRMFPPVMPEAGQIIEGETAEEKAAKLLALIKD